MRILNRITFVLAILFIVIGVVLIPVVSRVGEASAETLPLASSSRADQSDSLDLDSECVYGEWGTCSAECGGGTQTRTLIKGSSTVCTDLSSSCNTQACQEECEPDSCPTGCGFAGDPAYPDDCGGTMECPAIKSCAADVQCISNGEQCSDENACCGGLVCYQKPGDDSEKCWPSSDAGCQSKGQKCGDGYDECCDGLVCWEGTGGDSSCRKPVDCEGFWGDCIGDECGQQGIRFFDVTQWPIFGGDACPDPIWQACQTEPCEGDCQGHWGDCEGECGTGVRTYNVDVPAQEGGATCLYEEGYQEECSDLPACPVDCEGSWSECEGGCGTGTRTYHIDVQAQNGGKKCEHNVGYSEDCELDPCPADCQGEWGICEGGCGGVTGLKTYSIISPAQSGGTECEFEDGETAACQTDPCPIDCQGLWSGDCSGTCGTVGIETYAILVEAQWGGQACNYEDGETRNCVGDGCVLSSSDDGGQIPVTGSSGLGEKSVILALIGDDLGIKMAGSQRLILNMGFMFFGTTMVLEGIIRKFNL